MSTLHPIVELRVAGRVFNVPPSSLQELTEVDRRGVFNVTIRLIDQTFVELEDLIVENMRSTGIIEYRWGYPDVHRYTNWRAVTPMQITPQIDRQTGYSLTILGVSSVADAVSRKTSGVIKGKISQVVEGLAFMLSRRQQRAGLRQLSNIYVEETDDDANTERWWPYGPDLSIFQTIRQVFQPIAVSKVNKKAPYLFAVDPLGNFHFHTPDFVSARPQFRKFSYLFGMPGAVMSFQPDYNSKQLGLGAGGWVGSTYDPISKQYREVAINRATTEVESLHDRTIAAPPDESDPRSTQTAEVRFYEPAPVMESDVGADSGGVKQSFDRITNHWRLLQTRVQGAQMTLVGVPDLLDFSTSERFCDVHVVLPDIRGEMLSDRRRRSPGGLHWTSGRYDIVEVTHTIAASYTISASLARGTALQGPTESDPR